LSGREGFIDRNDTAFFTIFGDQQDIVGGNFSVGARTFGLFSRLGGMGTSGDGYSLLSGDRGIIFLFHGTGR
jgi:hypothetical protein